MKVESTSTLLHDLERVNMTPESFARYERKHPIAHEFESLAEYLTSFMARDPELTLTQIYVKSNISRSYGDQILSGRREHPGKYKLIPLCLAMGMNRKEINRALRLAGRAELDPRNRRDCVLIICANEGIDSIIDINELLMSYDLNPIL